MATLTDAGPGETYPHSARPEMLRFVPEGSERILDIGCHTGGFGEALKGRRRREVWGCEPNPAAARHAATLLDRVVNAEFTPKADIPDAYFDVVVFNDVLEHLVDPWEALRLARAKLREGRGSVVASVPNVLHVENVLHLLLERDFRYEGQGVRDRTHLRFFTRRSARRMFEESGYSVVRLEGINEYWWTPSLPRRVVFRLLGAKLEEMKYVQFAIVARPGS